MRRDQTTFRNAARLTFAATALSLFTLPCFAGTKTIFAPGVTADKGWYDVNKKSTANTSQLDFVACGAAAASNMLQYWQDGYTAAGNVLPNGTPNGIGSKEYAQGLGHYELAIFEEYLDNWGTEGTDPQLTIQWYFTGEGHNVSGYAQPKPGTGGFFADEYTNIQSVCGTNLVSNVQKFDDNGGWGSAGSSSAALSILSKHIISVLERGVGSIVIHAGFLHSITLWGAELDANNRLTAVYVTDSDDAQKARSASGIRKYTVSPGDKAGSVQLVDTVYGNVEITQLFGLTAYPIPEPSAFGLLAGLFALVFGVSRRRRK
ncbi:MAG: IdeS/Mac family cysteine endopeptidase [Opitutales bacterium]|nr:IdeS/Mac family cysteine endopeptidase [Opitutales bacterium]